MCFGSDSVSPRMIWKSSTPCRNRFIRAIDDVVRALAAAAAPHLDEPARKAAEAAASVMAMNNVYYRFLHHLGEGNPYQALPARLRMQAIGNPGVDHLDFELWCLAVSAINGCGACVAAHEQVVRGKAATAPMVQDAVRIAAVADALAAALDAVAAFA